MQPIRSSFNHQHPDYNTNEQAMLDGLAAFHAVEDHVLALESRMRDQFLQRKKLLPSDRLQLLLDCNQPFLPLCTLTGYQQEGDEDGAWAGGGLMVGIGYVSKVRCMVIVNNSAIKGGTMSPWGCQKTLRIQAIAKKQKLPVVTLAESGGANLKYSTTIFMEGAQAFANQARLSAQGIPQVTVVHGNATAGGAYQPGLSDWLVMVKQQAKLFLAGPPLLKAATGEIADDETLGGADMHCQVAGTSEFLALNDSDGIRQARNIVRNLGWNEHHAFKSTFMDSHPEPLYAQEELLAIVPANPKTPYDMREIIARIADGSQMLEFKTEWDDQTLCGRVRIMGHLCGIIGNNGPITPQGAAKATQFIQLCDQTVTPLLFLHNTTGFMVGTDAERMGIVKNGSKFLQAVANSRVPKISITVGGSYGAGNYAMCGRGLDPDFIFSWPTSRTAIMGGAQAGQVLRIIAEAKYARDNQTPDHAHLDEIESSTRDALDQSATAISASSRLWDDGLIDPRDTRFVVGFCLDIINDARARTLSPNTFGVARL